MQRPLWRYLWDTPRAAVFDVVLVAVLLPLGPILASLYPSDLPPQDYGWMGGEWVAVVLANLFTVSLLARRRFSVVLLAIGAAAMLVHAITYSAGIGPFLTMNMRTDPWMPADLMFAIYAFAAFETRPRRRVLGWILVAFIVFAALRLWTHPDGETLSNAFWVTAFPAVIGLWIGERRRLVVALRDRAERAEREQHLLAEQARADERAKMATEMHDVVTHRVSLMVLQAGALGVTSQDAATRTAAEELRAGGCQALDELRDFLGVLRSGDERAERTASVPAPDLSGLVAETEAVGIPVRLTELGSTAQVSPSVGRTAYRVVQEALTNVHKHAPGSSVDVHVEYGSDRVRLAVRNTRPETAGELAGHGGGAGLLGLRQRVELVGGTFHSGPTGDGGFEVGAILPGYVPTAEAVSG
ncbi:sensor histidine kinase [Saccharopolyspora gloriosae]|uniref:sensor histidine kinase n=1 Tax=Saccharopolyspora gloriosae TaxID=455344 RepID=UPI001FB7E6BB|nr:histidine kinase [Saccharopolyspora gloriosae]